MLSMLVIKDDTQEKTVKRLWQRLTKPTISAQMCPVGNIHYLKISAQPRREKLDWKMIRAYSLDCSERLLLPVGVEPPEDSGIRRLVPHEFKRRLMESMAQEILVCSSKQPELRRVAVYGQDNEVASLLPRLTKLAGEVRVITRRPYAVHDTVEELRRKTGAAITVSSELNAAGFDMLLAPAGGSGVIKLSESMIVIAPDRPNIPVALWINGARPSLPQVLEAEYDGRYDLTEFVGAFYEAGDMHELGRLCPAAGLTESGEFSPEDAALLIGR